MNQDSNQARPHWYQHLWPWVLMTIPFAAVLFGIFMVTTALYFPDDVVVDTYYKDGRAINQIIALDVNARERGLRASLLVQTNEDSMISLNTTTESVLHLFAYHVTDSKADREFLFLPDDTDGFVNTSAELPAILSSEGVWYLELRGDNHDWRLRTRVQTPQTQLEF